MILSEGFSVKKCRNDLGISVKPDWLAEYIQSYYRKKYNLNIIAHTNMLYVNDAQEDDDARTFVAEIEFCRSEDHVQYILTHGNADMSKMSKYVYRVLTNDPEKMDWYKYPS